MLLGNPYVVDRPLAEGDAFVGRYKLLAEVVQGVRRGRQLVLVYGSDRMGKTSFLRHLVQELSAEFLVVNVDWTWPEDGDASPEREREVAELAMQDLRSRIAEKLGAAYGQPVAESPDSSPSGGSLTAALGALHDREVVILVDGLSLQHLRGKAGAEFVARWQEWISSVPGAHFVVTVNGTLEGAIIFAPALASLPAVQLTGFALEETEDLLFRLAKGRLTYDFAAIRRIWELTSGHPYFVQLFGYQLFNVLSGGRRVRVPDVEQIVQDVVTAGHPVMDGIWSSFSPQAQVLLALSNELKGRHGVLAVRDLQDVACLQGVELSVSTIEAGLAECLAKGVLRRLSADSYPFFTELFRLWLAKYKPTAQTLVDLKFRKHLAVPRTSTAVRRRARGSTIGLSLAGLAVVTAVIVLWNMRGAAQRLSMGALPTSTPPPLATRATLVIGPAMGRIAYMAKDDADATWDVWLMRGDGSDPQRLTDDPADDMSPTWSADGKFLAFVSDRDGHREIYVMKADGTQQINLTHHPSEDWTPAWSPDGTSIAFSSYRDGNWEIYVMAADGSDPMRLTFDSAADYGPCWSPDSQQIAFHSNRDENWEIYVVTRDGEGLWRLTEDEATDFGPAWSPNGEGIAFESYRDGNMEIYLMAIDGSEPRNISDDPYSNEHGPAWARDGTKLFYFSNRDGGWDIFVMNPDGTEKANLTLSSAVEHGPEWHE